MFLYLLRRVKVIWKPSDYTNLLFLVNVSQHNRWLSDSHTLIISISLSWAEFSASPLAVLITPLCASDYPRLVKTYFPLMVNKRKASLSSGGMSTHFCGWCRPLSSAVSISQEWTHTHTHIWRHAWTHVFRVCISDYVTALECHHTREGGRRGVR